jgi:hypothetical protein
MAALSIQVPYPVFYDRDGQPLENGNIYIGVANLDPETNPLQVYYDEALTITASQPLITSGGYVYRNGTPTQLYVNAADFSITVNDSKGLFVYNFPQATGIIAYTGAEAVEYDPPFAGAVTSGYSVADKLSQTVSINDFGAVGDGVVDDTAAIQAALDASYHVVVPAGMTPLITSTITIPEKTKLEFLTGTGVLSGLMPGSYFIKSSTLNGVGIYILGTGIVSGGGLLCQSGNGGDGVQLAGNSSILRDFIVVQAGRDGVRVGVDGVYANTNSTILEYVRSRDSGRYGFYIHDGVSVLSADANAGTLLQCTAINNGSDGFRLGKCWWVSVINCLAEGNGDYGLYLSGLENSTYPECRWATIIGGDYNEGNNGTTNVDQVYDSSYFSTFINPDQTQFPTNTTTTGFQGAGFRSQYGAAGRTSFYGGTILTGAENQYPVVFDSGQSAGVSYGPIIRKRTFANNGDGTSLSFNLSPNTVDPFLLSGRISSLQADSQQYSMVFNVYRSGLIEAGRFNANALAFTPGADNTWANGFPSLRWNVVYAVSGTINTSDIRQKQQIRPLADIELVVAKRLKSLIRAFKWTEAVDKKGDKARTHIGLMAQEVESAFKAEGLNGFDYGLLCYDEWDDEYEPEYTTEIITDASGAQVETQVPTGNQKLIRAAGNSYGVRYDQLTLFVLAAMGDA